MPFFKIVKNVIKTLPENVNLTLSCINDKAQP